MKALEKDRSRRYEDSQRLRRRRAAYLVGEAVLAVRHRLVSLPKFVSEIAHKCCGNVRPLGF